MSGDYKTQKESGVDGWFRPGVVDGWVRSFS